jgi:hypothetical protein
LPTRRHKEGESEPELRSYCDWFLRILRAGFGEDKAIGATIFAEATDEPLPVRLVGIHLNWPGHKGIAVETIQNSALVEHLHRVYRLLVEETEGVSFRRIARVFDVLDQGEQRIPTVFMVKLDQARYWSRTIALRDADEVSLEIMQWHSAGGPGESEARAAY